MAMKINRGHNCFYGSFEPKTYFRSYLLKAKLSSSPKEEIFIIDFILGGFWFIFSPRQLIESKICDRRENPRTSLFFKERFDTK